MSWTPRLPTVSKMALAITTIVLSTQVFYASSPVILADGKHGRDPPRSSSSQAQFAARPPKTLALHPMQNASRMHVVSVYDLANKDAFLVAARVHAHDAFSHVSLAGKRRTY